MAGLLTTIRSRLASAIMPTAPVGSGGWTPIAGIIREPYTGAWQNNDALTINSALQNPAVFRCVSLIAGDIGKTPLNLVALDSDGIWTATTSPAFSPVLRRPNRYQLFGQFLEQWVISKLINGNAYILKDRDSRGVVTALYVLDPTIVHVLVAPDGTVFYQLGVSYLAGLPEGVVAAPASEIIHDRWNCAIHPLIGISPLYACGGDAQAANAIRTSQIDFFNVGGRPSGLLVAPTEVSQDTIDRLSAAWAAKKPGQTAITGWGFKYQDIGPNATDSQLIDQSDHAVATIAGCFGVPVSYVDSSKQPPYANSEATQLQYLSQCLQVHMTGIENALDDGLELPTPYGTEFDLSALMWMDTATRTAAAKDGIASGALSPDEARFDYYGKGPVKGGDTPYLQQQNWPLDQLANRPAPTIPAAPPATPNDPANPTPEQVAAAVGELAGV